MIEPWAPRTLALAATLLLGAAACSSESRRDLNYGSDVGADWKPADGSAVVARDGGGVSADAGGDAARDAAGGDAGDAAVAAVADASADGAGDAGQDALDGGTD